MFWHKKKEVLSLEIASYDCTGCGSCVERCRRNVLKMIDNGHCKLASVEFPENCVGCGKCVRTCPAGAIELVTIKIINN